MKPPETVDIIFYLKLDINLFILTLTLFMIFTAISRKFEESFFGNIDLTTRAIYSRKSNIFRMYQMYIIASYDKPVVLTAFLILSLIRLFLFSFLIFLCFAHLFSLDVIAFTIKIINVR